MTVGLDLGAAEFRSIRDLGRDLVARRCLASYLVLKDTPGHRKLLEHMQALHGTCGDDLVVFGQHALECSAMLDIPVIPLLRDGRLQAADPVARQIVALMVEAVLPAAERPGEICGLTVPGGYALVGDTQSLDVRFFMQLVTLRGYTPQLISSGQAIVLAELSGASFSGLGISLGAVNCEVGVIHCGRELARCTIAGQLGELLQASLGDSQVPPEIADRTLARALTSILAEAREALVSEGSIRLMQQPVSVVCSGGITALPGFPNLFQQSFDQAGWPIRTRTLRVPENPRFCVARGALIKAILEGRPMQDQRVA